MANDEAKPAATRLETRRRLIAAAAGVAAAIGFRREDQASAKRKRKKKKKKSCPTSPGPETLAVTGSCLGSQDGVLQGGGTTSTGQTFQATEGGRLRKITVAVSKPQGSTGDYRIELVRSNDGVQPSTDPADVLASIVISNASVPDGVATLSGQFPTSNVLLTEGLSYSVVVSRPGTIGGDFFLSVSLTPCENFAWTRITANPYNVTSAALRFAVSVAT